MAGDETLLSVFLRSIYEKKGTDEAAEGLDKVKQKTKEAKGAFDELGYSGEALKRAFIELFALQKFIETVKEGIERVGKMEQTMIALEAATEKNGHSFEVTRGEIEKKARAMQDAAGIDDDVSVPAMVRVYQATRDVEKAMTLAGLASDVSVATNRTFADSFELVFRAAQGHTRELRSLGIQIDENAPRHTKAIQALTELDKRFRGATENAHGWRVEWARLSEQIETVIDGAIEPLMTGLTTLAKVGLSASHLVGNAIAIVAEWFRYGGAQVANFATLVKKAFTLDAAGVKESLTEIDRESELHAEIQRQIGDKHLKDQDAIWTRRTEKVKAAERDVTRAVIHEEAERAERARSTADLEAQLLNARAQIEADHMAKFRLQLQALEAEKRKALEADEKGVEKTEREKELIEQTFAAKRIALAQQVVNRIASERKREADEARRAADQELRVAEKTAALEVDIEKEKARGLKVLETKHAQELRALDAERVAALKELEKEHLASTRNMALVDELYAEKRKALDQSYKMSKIQMELDAAAAAIGNLQTVFGESKALNRALAAVNIAQAAIKTYAQWGWPWGLVFAALVVAAGVAQQRKIEETQMERSSEDRTAGRGFDVKAYDQMAYAGGERWARDMVREFGAGATDTMRGWQHGMMTAPTSRTSTTVDQRRTYNVTLTGPNIMGPENRRFVRQLKLALEAVDRDVDQRAVAGRAG